MSDSTNQAPTPGEGFPPPPPTWAPPQGPPSAQAESSTPKAKMSKGKKIGLWAGGLLLASAAIGAMGGDPKPELTAAPAISRTSATVPSPPVAESAPTGSTSAATPTADTAAADKAAADKAAADKAAAEKAAADKAAADKAAKEKAAAEKAAAEEAAANAMTTSQEQAISKAESYLEFTAFSRTGLIKQLRYEEFSTADATFAVDHITVDWKKQAADKAESYLEFTAFSRKGLIRQLEYEGFTSAQAVHGANSVGL